MKGGLCDVFMSCFKVLSVIEDAAPPRRRCKVFILHFVNVICMRFVPFLSSLSEFMGALSSFWHCFSQAARGLLYHINEASHNATSALQMLWN